MKRTVLTGATFLLTVLATVAWAGQGPVCLSTRAIASTSPAPDGRTIVFRMTNGSVWRNDLRGRCPDLRWDGFVWSTRNPLGEVCEFEQTLSLLKTGEVCALGKFTEIEPAGHHNFSTGEK
ncbi:MAG: hypothetical protein ACREFW_00850 [Rhizomicrobium sp.]